MALHAYNTIVSLPLSRAERAWLLCALHEALGYRPPPPALAAALCAHGRTRTFRKLRHLPGFGRRRHAALRRVFADPSLNLHLVALLTTLTRNPPAEVDVEYVPAHPFGEDAPFPPVIARLLEQDGRLLYGRARSLPGFSFCSHILDFREATEQTPSPEAVIIGGGYVGCELALYWGRAGSRVTLLHNQPALLVGYPEAAVAEVVRLLEAVGVVLLLDAHAERWQRDGAGVVVEVKTADGHVALRADRILVAVGLIYPGPAG